VATFSVQFYTFWTESVLSERISLKLMLTLNDTNLDKECYTKVVENFYTFPESTYKPSTDNCYRSSDLWKSGGVAGISSFQDRSSYLNKFGH
jgi:hypothetical protein